MDNVYYHGEKALDQHQHLLKDVDQEQQRPCPCRSHASTYQARSRTSNYLIGTVLLVAYSIVLSYIAANLSTYVGVGQESQIRPSSLRQAIKYETIPLEPDNIQNSFAGDPRPEHDKAWSDILENIHVRFTADEMRQINKTSLELTDGNFMVQLGAYHELHCVKWIRKWIHRDHYWPYLTGTMLEERKVHIEHCLELMRLNAMCRGSTDITTFEWVGSRPKPISTTQHKCINWENFDAWNHDRRVVLSDLSIFKDRPEQQEWEIADDAVRLGASKGDTKGFEQLLEGKIMDESQNKHT